MSGKKVLVIGGTGMLGKPVVAALAKAGFQVSALVRKADTALPPGVKAVVGDLFDPASLERAMQGQQVVYLNLAIQPGQKEHEPLSEREGLAHVIAAAKKAGVGRLSSIVAMVNDQQGRDGYDWWVLRVKQEAARTLATCGLSVTLFRCASFMDNFEHGMRQGNAINLAGKARHATRYVSGTDYGALVARALARDVPGSETWVAQGPEALMPEEAAQRFIAARPGQPLTLKKAPLGLLKVLGLFMPPLAFVAKLMDALNRYQEPFEAKETWDALGPPALTLEAWARSLPPR